MFYKEIKTNLTSRKEDSFEVEICLKTWYDFEVLYLNVLLFCCQ